MCKPVSTTCTHADDNPCWGKVEFECSTDVYNDEAVLLDYFTCEGHRGMYDDDTKAYKPQASPFNMRLVESSNVSAVGYDATTETLRVRFGSASYDYAKVPVDVFTALSEAESKGSFIARQIKPNYKCEKVK